MPAHLVITGSMGTADLDLSHALIHPIGCVIEVLASWTTVRRRDRRPHGRLAGGSMSTLKDKVGPPTVPGGPVIDIRGRAGWTTVVLRRS